MGPVLFLKKGNSPAAEVAPHSLKHTIIRELKEKEMNIVSCLPDILFSTYMIRMPQKAHSYFEVQENISW